MMMDEAKQTHSQLREALKRQLEFYFSPQNLAQDPFLVSQMNSEKYVPIDIVASFKMIKNLTSDKGIIVEVMRESTVLRVNKDGTLVKPVLKMARTTLILRDIPRDTPEVEIRTLFDNEGCGKVSDIRSDVGDTWFVSFETEDDCTKSGLFLQGKTFKGKPIRCGVKSENILRSFYTPASHSSANGFQPYNTNYGYSGNGGFYSGRPYPYIQNYQGDAQWTERQQSSHQQQTQRPRQMNSQKNHRFHHANDRRPQKHRPQNHAYNQSHHQNPNFEAPGMKQRKPIPRRKQKKAHFKRDESGTSGQSSSQHTDASAIKQQKPCLGPEEFPALPSSNRQSTLSKNSVLNHYGKSKMASIVRALKQASVKRPDGLQKHEQLAVIRENPIQKCQLGTPFPVMYPASPSPLLAARPHHSIMPDLDLGPAPPLTRHALDLPITRSTTIAVPVPSGQQGVALTPVKKQQVARVRSLQQHEVEPKKSEVIHDDIPDLEAPTGPGEFDDLPPLEVVSDKGIKVVNELNPERSSDSPKTQSSAVSYAIIAGGGKSDQNQTGS